MGWMHHSDIIKWHRNSTTAMASDITVTSWMTSLHYTTWRHRVTLYVITRQGVTSFIKGSAFRTRRRKAISYHFGLDTPRSFLRFRRVGEGQVRGEYYAIISHQADRYLGWLTHKLPRALERRNIWYKTQQAFSTSVKTGKQPTSNFKLTWQTIFVLNHF